MLLRAITIAVVVGLASGAAGQVPYGDLPDWVSIDTQVSTGGALVDLNRDGWLDFVVSNGNDMAQQHLAVYTNRGDGTFSGLPSWQSADFVYNGHLDVADVNGDGWPDVAVATLGRFSATGPIARVYLNNAGTLSSTPDWSANVIGNAFGVAFGDMNNDGRPDLAVATGWAYSPQNFYHNYVYLNVGGTLGATPAWTSDDTDHTQGVVWVDTDSNGWLDLVFAASASRNRIYRNYAGVIETVPSWYATDVASPDAIMVTAGDVTGDGIRELFFADNNQLGGSGRYRQYTGQPGFWYPTTADWTVVGGYCSAVALADVDSDGDLDLATGAWWQTINVFTSTPGEGLMTLSSWHSQLSSVVEKIVFGDIDKVGVRPESYAVLVPPFGRRLFYLPHQSIQEVLAVVADDEPLGPTQYVVNRELGWLTVGVDADTLRVDYTVSCSLDMAVTNWDDDEGNYVYYSQLFTLGDTDCDGQLGFGDINPFVMLLTGSYDQYFPDCYGHTSGDINGDGTVEFGDINPFVALLAGSQVVMEAPR